VTNSAMEILNRVGAGCGQTTYKKKKNPLRFAGVQFTGAPRGSPTITWTWVD